MSVISEATALTDRQATTVKVKMATTRSILNGEYWTLNRTVIQNKLFKIEVHPIIQKYWEQASSFNSWETLGTTEV